MFSSKTWVLLLLTCLLCSEFGDSKRYRTSLKKKGKMYSKLPTTYKTGYFKVPTRSYRYNKPPKRSSSYKYQNYFATPWVSSALYSTNAFKEASHSYYTPSADSTYYRRNPKPFRPARKLDLQPALKPVYRPQRIRRMDVLEPPTSNVPTLRDLSSFIDALSRDGPFGLREDDRLKNASLNIDPLPKDCSELSHKPALNDSSFNSLNETTRLNFSKPTLTDSLFILAKHFRGN